MSSNTGIHLHRNDIQEGPYAVEKLQQMLTAGEVLPETLAWKEGLSEWVQLRTLLPVATVAPPLPSIPQGAAPFKPDGVFRPPGAPPIVAAVDGPKGVGGWLLFFCLGMVLLRPVMVVPQMIIGWRDTSRVFSVLPSVKTALTFEYVCGGISVLIGMVIGIIIWCGHRKGRTLACLYLLFRIAAYVLVSAISIYLMSDLPDAAIEEGIAGAVGGGVGELIYFGIWYSYFHKSKRVKNTYGEA